MYATPSSFLDGCNNKRKSRPRYGTENAFNIDFALSVRCLGWLQTRKKKEARPTERRTGKGGERAGAGGSKEQEVFFLVLESGGLRAWSAQVGDARSLDSC